MQKTLQRRQYEMNLYIYIYVYILAARQHSVYHPKLHFLLSVPSFNSQCFSGGKRVQERVHSQLSLFANLQRLH